MQQQDAHAAEGRDFAGATRNPSHGVARESSPAPYRDNWEHLQDELRRLGLLCRRLLLQKRQGSSREEFDELRGLFITGEEIESLQEAQAGQHENGTETAALDAEIERLGQQIGQRVEGALQKGVALRLPLLAWLFDLSPFERDALLVCLAPEIDLKYEKLYAYLQDDVTRKRPSLDLILRLLTRSSRSRLSALGRLLPGAPLLEQSLVAYAGGAYPQHPALLSRFLKVEDRIAAYLLESRLLDEEAQSFARMAEQTGLDQLVLPQDFLQSLQRLFQERIDNAVQGNSECPPVFLFCGPQGVGKSMTASALCGSRGFGMLEADLDAMLCAGDNLEDLALRLFREARLQSAAVYLDGAEAAADASQPALRTVRPFFRALQRIPVVLFLGSSRSWENPFRPPDGLFARIDFPVPGYPLRRRLWQRAADSAGCTVSPQDLDELAGRFELTASRIESAVRQACQSASLRAPDQAGVLPKDFYRACRQQSRTRLDSLAVHIRPVYSWDDICLPSDGLRQLREICRQVRFRHKVFGEWGFEGKMSLGKGLAVLFSGPSGTGKTMAAEIIANDLGLDLYKIDLSSLVSKYIGETEKNLDRIFCEAEHSNAILFFDEADALFGKRSQVKDAHDRYSNIEVNYLLQKVEEYRGAVILASNLQKNIDNAFTRRLRFIVEFPFPDEKARRRIWEGVFPPQTPLSRDIDFGFLSRKLQISGGHIRTAALNAAFLAVDEGEVGMRHILRSVRRLYQKMGKVCVKSDFEEYFAQIRDED